MAVTTSLFGGIPLPVWGEGTPERLYALFLRHQEGSLNRFELDEYARLLMVVVANAFHSNDFLHKLPQIRLDPQDVAQEAAAHLLRKTGAMRLKHPCWKVMLWVMNVSVKRYVLTQASTRKRRGGREMPATDYYVDHGKPEEASTADGIATIEPPSERDLFNALLAAEDRIIGDIPIKKPLSIETVERLFRCLVRSLSSGGQSLTTHAGLPVSLKEQASPELHGLVAARITRFVSEFAEVSHHE